MVEEIQEVAPRWGLGDVAGGLAVGLVATAVAVSVWVAITGAHSGDDPSLSTLAIGQAGLWVGLLGAPILASRRKGSGDLRQDFGLEFRATDPLVGIPIGVLCQLVLVPLIYLPLQQFVSKKDLEEPVRRVTESAQGSGFFALAVVVVVGASLVEELFFRGLL